MTRWILATAGLVALGIVAVLATAPARCRAAAERDCAGEVAEVEAGVLSCRYACAGSDPWASE